MWVCTTPTLPFSIGKVPNLMAKRIMFPMELQMWGGIPQFQTHLDIIQYMGASHLWRIPNSWNLGATSIYGNPHIVGETYPVKGLV